jgi:hypothetical protein
MGITSGLDVASILEEMALNGSGWALFELCNDLGIGKDKLTKERPLREWEIVADILSVWDSRANNALIVKKYSYVATLLKPVFS